MTLHKLFLGFFIKHKQEKTMKVAPNIFGEYLASLQESQRKEVKLSDTRAIWYGMGSTRYIEVLQ